MPQLTVRQKFSLNFGLYIFLFLTVFLAVFFTLFRFLEMYGTRQELSQEAVEMIAGHMEANNNQLLLKRDQNGKTLLEHLINESYSGIIFEKDFSINKVYGIFALSAADNFLGEEKIKEHLEQLARDVSQKKQVTFAKVNIQNRTLMTLTKPLIINGQDVGVLMLGKPLGDAEMLTNLAFALLTGLAIIGILGSFALGYSLSKRAFRPLYKVINAMKGVDLYSLDRTITLTGHPNDELVILAQKYNEMLSRIKDMAIKQKNFISNASHELKTPLAKAVSTLDVSLSNSKSNPLLLKQVRSDLLNLGSYIDKLLLLAKDRSAVIIPKSPIKLKPLFNKVAKELTAEIKKKHLNISVKVKGDPTVKIPVEYLEMLFFNLLSNAIKYTTANTAIYISAQKKNATVEVIVRDEGKGIPKAELQRVFERYFRSQSTSDQPGKGIGLALVKQICDLYTISIQIDSDTGKGTSVLLVFKQ